MGTALDTIPKMSTNRKCYESLGERPLEVPLIVKRSVMEEAHRRFAWESLVGFPRFSFIMVDLARAWLGGVPGVFAAQSKAVPPIG